MCAVDRVRSLEWSEYLGRWLLRRKIRSVFNPGDTPTSHHSIIVDEELHNPTLLLAPGADRQGPGESLLLDPGPVDLVRTGGSKRTGESEPRP